MSHYYSRPENKRLPSGLFFRADQAEMPIQPLLMQGRDIERSGTAHHQINYNEFVVPEYRATKDDNELYLPLLKVSVEVEVVATIAWTKLTQTFTNQAVHSIKEATYCFPLYEKSAITVFTCTIGSGKVLKGVVKPKLQAKAEFKEGIARQRVAALLEEHTPEVFETSIGNIPAQTTIKIEISYITELKADLSGHGILVTIPTSVAPRYGPPPNSASSLGSSRSLAVPHENGLDIQIQISSPVAISKIESQTHPVSVEMGTRGHTTTRNIRNLSQKQTPPSFDPKNARATLSDRSACLGKDFVLLVQAMDGQLLASRALLEPHPKAPNHSALMVSINLRDLYTPNIIARKESNEIVFLADRSGSMHDKMEALKTAMRFFLKSLPGNCTFNICSFGDTYALMWPESRPYNQENVDAALSYITMNFAADMGGTEILSGLRHVVLKSNSYVDTEIIVLTDGEVWDSENMFDFIRETRALGPKARTRFFALGIGEAVSHHLIEGIGRHGGGLAEVVSVTSAGDWKGRVIRMLEAALMPSTWKVEIIMDDFAITSINWEERACVQAPHYIPDFHAFTRSSVYFILNQQPGAKTIQIKATASSREVVTAELPIKTVESRHACIYALAAKAALGDLESGQSRLHDTKSNDNARKIEKDIEDLVRSEGEKLGTEWSISSKWTSFVVVDDNNALEKPSRWYQAEKSDLAELTRPRVDARHLSSSSMGPAIGYRTPGRDYSDKSTRTGGNICFLDTPLRMPSDQQLKSCEQSQDTHEEELRAALVQGYKHLTSGSQLLMGGEEEHQTRPTPQEWQELRAALVQEYEHLTSGSQLLMEGEEEHQTRPTPKEWQELRAYQPRREIDAQQREPAAAAARREPASEQEVEQAKPDRENRAIQARQDHETKAYAPDIAREDHRLRVQGPTHQLPMRQAPSMSQSHNEQGEHRASCASRQRVEFPGRKESKGRKIFGKRPGNQERVDVQAKKEPEARRAHQAREKLQAEEERQPERQLEHQPSQDRQELREGLQAREEAQKRQLGSSASTSKDLHRPSKCSEPANFSQLYSNSTQLHSWPSGPAILDRCLRGQTTREITLEALIDAQTVAGSFDLGSELRGALNQKFKSTMRKIANDWFRALGSRRSTQDVPQALDTAISIVWIEVKYAESQELWGLAVQKAKGFLNTIVPEEDNCFELFKILRGELLNSNEGGTGEREAENKEGDEWNKREVENKEENEEEEANEVNEREVKDREENEEKKEGNEGNEVSDSTSVEQGPILRFLNTFLGLG